MRLRSADVTWRELEGETVILDLAASRYLTTNRSGALLLRLLVEERSRDELVAALTAEYGIDRDRAATDVGAFTDRLRDHQLLVDTDEPAPSDLSP